MELQHYFQNSKLRSKIGRSVQVGLQVPVAVANHAFCDVTKLQNAGLPMVRSQRK